MRAESELKQRVDRLKEQGRAVKVAAILFTEDTGSRFYSEHKRMAAERVGIRYELFPFSITTPLNEVISEINRLNHDESVTGIIIQKPTGNVWRENHPSAQSENFNDWWSELYKHVNPKMDVDGLHPTTAAAIADGTWEEQGRVLPATCRAVLKVMDSPQFKEVTTGQSKYLLIGRSDLLGAPLYHILKQQGRAVEIIGRSGFAELMSSDKKLKDADVIVTATGREYLVTGDMIKPGAALIDVGEPRPDIDPESIAQKAAFLTPVPGGVGPLTVVSLLENAVKLAEL